MIYKTQMEAAKKGIITKELQAVAEKEQMDTARLMKRKSFVKRLQRAASAFPLM